MICAASAVVLVPAATVMACVDPLPTASDRVPETVSDRCPRVSVVVEAVLEVEALGVERAAADVAATGAD